MSCVMEKVIPTHQHHTFRSSSPPHLLCNWVYSRDLHGCHKAAGMLLCFQITHQCLFTVHLPKVQEMTQFHWSAPELSKSSSCCIQSILSDSWYFALCLSETTGYLKFHQVSLFVYGFGKIQDSKWINWKFGMNCEFMSLLASTM